MEKLRKFKPVLASCSQGQKRRGVEDGALYVYNNLFKEICNSQVYSFAHTQFDTQIGYQKLYGICKALNFPLTIGGDHSVASSSLMASNQKFKDMHVIWIDAHPDIHTYKSTQSGNKHGTPLSVCTGLENMHWTSRMTLKLLPFENLTYVGIRDIDDYEAQVIAEKKIRHLTPTQCVDFIKNLDRPIHISFDVDGLDPKYCLSTGTTADDGLTPADVAMIYAEALREDKLVSTDIVEFNEKLGDPVESIKHLREVFKGAIPANEHSHHKKGSH